VGRRENRRLERERESVLIRARPSWPLTYVNEAVNLVWHLPIE